MSAIDEGLDIDPALVPVYPVVRMEIRPVDGGLAEGFENGDQVCPAMHPDEVKQLLTDRAAQVAASRPGAIRAVRALVIEDGEVAAHLVVTADGVRIPAAEPRQRRRRGRKVALLVLGSLAAVSVMAAGAVHLTQRAQADLPAPVATHTVVPTPTPTQLPVLGPKGWSTQAAWSAPLGQQSSTASIATSPQGVVAAPAADGQGVVGRRISDGVQLWAASVDDSVSYGPVLSRIGAQPAFVAATSSTMFAWSPLTGHQIGRWELPEDGSATVVAGPAGTVVATDGQHALIVQGSKLVARVIPAGAASVAVQGPALVVAGDGALWRVTGDQLAPAPTKLSAPAGTTWQGVAGCSGTTLIMAYAPAAQSASGTVVLRAFDLDTGAVRWTSGQVPAAQAAVSGDQPLVLAPSQGWGVYGSSVVVLATGKTIALPTDWQTSAVGDQVAFGSSGGGVGQVSVSGVVSAPAADGATQQQAPTAPIAAQDGTAFLSASDGQDTFLYAIRPVSR